ncbi:MAG: NmrA family NAD(P)-binding protein [Polyangiaceae bacterium]
MNIAVIGGTGTVGRRLVAWLTESGHRVRALGRSTGFDLDQPTTWGRAFDGAERAFYITRHGEADPERLGSAIFEAMRASGVRGVVNLTGFGVDKNPDSPMRRLELALEKSGLAFTHLRPSYFMQNFCTGRALRDIQERGQIAMAAGDAHFSYIDARDIAAVAGVALTTGAHTGEALNLTGGKSVTHGEIAEILSQATGRTIRYHALSDEEERERCVAEGLPAARIETRLAFLAVARTGAFARVWNDVHLVLRRPPISFESFAHDHAKRWKAVTQ